MEEISINHPHPEIQKSGVESQSEGTLAVFLEDYKRYRRAEEVAGIVIRYKYGTGLKGRFLSLLFSGSIAGDYMTRRSRSKKQTLSFQ